MTVLRDESETLYEAMDRHFFGKFRGVVTANDDPTRRGRVQVRVPTVMGDERLWALPCVPYAGDGVGLFALPPVGTSVWVEFEGGDPTYPIWAGCFWSDGQIASANAGPDVKFWKTDQVTLRIDDAEGSIVIETAGGARITIGPTGIEAVGVVVKHTANGATTKLDAAGFDVNNGAFSVI
jgi:uncharacterized protein involved in type VI secretion and phage assembly